MNGSDFSIPGTRVLALAVLAFLYVPIVVLVGLSLSSGASSLGGLNGFSLHWYRAMLQDRVLLGTLFNSLAIAIVASSAATIVATAAALATLGYSGRTVRNHDTMIALPLAIPEIITAVALLILLSLLHVRLGLAAICFAHMAIAIPIAYLPIRARVDGLNRSFLDAAADLYATPGRRFFRVTMPLIIPGVAAGGMLAFIASLSDVVVSYFLSGPGSTTLPVYVLSMVRQGVSPVVNAVSTLLLVLPTTFLIGFYILMQITENKRGVKL